MDLKETGAGVDPRRHWYYRTKGLSLRRNFAAKIAGHSSRVNVFDIGAGSGVFSDMLIDRFSDRIDRVVRVDLHYPAEGPVADARLRAGTIEYRRSVPGEIENAFILLIDVLEHVADDGEFLREIVAACRGRNRVFITVPAFQWLWSGHDEFLQHYRRYSLRSLRSLALASGIANVRSYYMFGCFLPVAWMRRRLVGVDAAASDLRPLAPWLNALMTAAGRMDARFTPRNRLGGLTVALEGTITGTQRDERR